jgi:hypothetical protein
MDAMGVVIKLGLTHMALIVFGALGLFDDAWLPPVVKPRGQEAERQNRSSFPSALSGVCHYIMRREAEDRGRFIRALCEAFVNLCQANNKRKETYKMLVEKHMKKTSLTSSHMEISERDKKWQVDALDKFGVLMWFTETSANSFKWVELGSAEFDTRLQALQRLNPRWTREMVTTMLRDLRFKEPPGGGHAAAVSVVAPGWQCEWRVTEPSTPFAASTTLAEVAAAAAAAAVYPTIADLERARQLQRQRQQEQEQELQAAAEGDGEDAADNGDAEVAQAAKKHSKPQMNVNETASKKAKTGADKALPR